MTLHATWPDVAMVLLGMLFFFACTLLAGAAEAGKREREKDKAALRARSTQEGDTNDGTE